MKCPYLSEDKAKKTCMKMKDMGIDEEVSDFDVQHYCQGSPYHCYFFRISEKQTMAKSDRTLKQKLSQLFTAT